MTFRPIHPSSSSPSSASSPPSAAGAPPLAAATPPPERLIIRSPQDALAAVPVILGFAPSDSAVLLTFGGRHTFHARVDLPCAEPGRPIDVEWLRPRLTDVAGQLLGPARQHAVQSVVLVLYSADRCLAEAAQHEIEAAFAEADIPVLASVCADGRRWWSSDWPGGDAAEGTPYDASGHEFRARSVLRGVVVHGSRADLAALLDPVPEAVAAVRAVRRQARTIDAEAVADLVARGMAAGRLDDVDLARLLLGLRRVRGRDAAWQRLDRAGAEPAVRFWTDVVQRAPSDLASAPAAVLALAAWLSGHGALALCAIDRCRALVPRHTLARLVADLLDGAVPPEVWDQIGPGLRAEPATA